jgi:GT2 family glycosyltransferase
LRADGEKLYIRGVTYGPFRPDGEHGEMYRREQAQSDFAQMASRGINALRTYTVPPGWLLDTAADHGLRVLAGLPWEQHIAFLDSRRGSHAIVDRVREAAVACAGHPALLGYVVGNEIPAPIVRWHGAKPVERFIERLQLAVRDVDPGALCTYVNYPTTEYLQLPFLDFVCFNVFLESQGALQRYLYRLHNLAGERPLVLAEIGLDSLRHGAEAQAELIEWQLREAFEAGCAGTFVFAWTDEWHRGGHDIEDWTFGVTTRERVPKPALASLARAYATVPTPTGRDWPKMSVVIATYNGARTLRECCEALRRVRYANVEVIVVDDGSADGSGRIADACGFRLITTENRGLAAARNTGIAAASGEIVVFLDDDAYPDPDWLTYLALEFEQGGFAGVGGPNLPVPNDGLTADAVAAAPGGPTHVLLSDREAEHIPGCNMAFRRSWLVEIGGFDARFRAAGDDVDLCWRVQEQGGKLGFAPAAMVWHHRRGSIRAYLNQQRGYGKAEAMLEQKWPERYTAGGHVTWRGRLYGHALTHTRHRLRWRVYYGQWGTNLFQPLYQPGGMGADVLLLLPELYLLIAGLLLLTVLGLWWEPLLLAGPLVLAMVGLLAVRAARVAGASIYPTTDLAPSAGALRLVLTISLHLLQPLARLTGRVAHGLTLWRRRGAGGVAIPRSRRLEIWSENWAAPEEWVRRTERLLVAGGAVCRRGGECDRWDLEVRGGTLAGMRILGAPEEHGSGQLVRFAFRPHWSLAGLATLAFMLALGAGAALSGAAIAAGSIGAMAAALAVRTVHEAASAAWLADAAITGLQASRANTPPHRL